jgi:hypothetical protein
MPLPVEILGQEIMYPTQGDSDYANETTRFVTLTAQALVPIAGLYNATTGQVGLLAMDDDGDLTFNGQKVMLQPN